MAYDTDAELFYTRFAMSTKSLAIAEIGAIVDAASSNMTRWMKQLDERLFRIRRNTHDWIQKLPSKLGLCTLVVDGNHSSSTFVSWWNTNTTSWSNDNFRKFMKKYVMSSLQFAVASSSYLSPSNISILILRPNIIISDVATLSTNFEPGADILSGRSKEKHNLGSLYNRGSTLNANWSSFGVIANTTIMKSAELTGGKVMNPKPHLSAFALARISLRRYQFVIDTQEKRYRFGALPDEAEVALGQVYGEIVARNRSMPGAAKGQVR